MSPSFVVGPRGPSHGHVMTNASHKKDLMVASYPCNEGGCWIRVSLERPYLKWVKPYVLNIIMAIGVSLRHEIEVINGVINNKKLLKKGW